MPTKRPKLGRRPAALKGLKPKGVYYKRYRVRGGLLYAPLATSYPQSPCQCAGEACRARGRLVMCSNGYHAFPDSPAAITQWLGLKSSDTQIWEVRAYGQVLTHKGSNKVCVRALRLIRKIAPSSPEGKRLRRIWAGKQ